MYSKSRNLLWSVWSVDARGINDPSDFSGKLDFRLSARPTTDDKFGRSIARGPTPALSPLRDKTFWFMQCVITPWAHLLRGGPTFLLRRVVSYSNPISCRSYLFSTIIVELYYLILLPMFLTISDRSIFFFFFYAFQGSPTLPS